MLNITMKLFWYLEQEHVASMCTARLLCPTGEEVLRAYGFREFEGHFTHVFEKAAWASRRCCVEPFSIHFGQYGAFTNASRTCPSAISQHFFHASGSGSLGLFCFPPTKYLSTSRIISVPLSFRGFLSRIIGDNIPGRLRPLIVGDKSCNNHAERLLTS